MSEEGKRVPAIDWTSIGHSVSRYETLLKVNDRNKYQLDAACKSRDGVIMAKAKLKSTIDRCTQIYKDVQKNLDDKKRLALQEFNEAINEASLIVADSNMDGTFLKVNGDDATLCTPRGHNINKREGGAQRAVLGQMLRYVAMTQQLNVLPLILLDESFFALSENTSVEMRDYLVAMSEHFLIIGIEQKDTLFSGIENKRKFRFYKNNEDQTIIREV